MAAPTSPNSSRIDRRFDVLRSKVDQEAGAAKQAAQEGLARKAVSQGAQGSGAFMKLGAQQDQDLAARRQNAINDVEAQRETAQSQADEVQAQRDFARAEREASQQFAQGERIGSQRFQASEAAAQRGFSKDLFNKDMAFKQQVQKDANSQFAKQFKLAMDQFGYDQKVGDFNMKMAEAAFNKKSLTESLMSGGKIGEFAGGVLNRWSGGRIGGSNSDTFNASPF